jgi:PAS domain S-box-containing protein
MNRSSRSLALIYGVSLAGLAVAVLSRWLLDPILGDNHPLVILFAAISVAVWMGGYRPALLVTVLGYMVCAYYFIQPRGEIALREPGQYVGLLLYLATALIIIYFGEAVNRAHQDIRAGAEAAHGQAELMRTTLASIGDGVITTDPEGRITLMNSVAEALTGWTNGQVAGKPLVEVFHIVNEETRLEVENPALRALREGVIVGLANHTVLIAKDGTERQIDDSAAPILSAGGELVGCVLVFRDISERYRAEAEQRAAQEEITRTLESVTDGFMRYDRDWRIVYVNAEAERINRLTRSEMIGRILWEAFPSLIGTRFETEFKRAVADQVTVEFESFYEPYDRWYSLKCYPTDEGGLTTYIRDITAQKESELALRASEERLEFVRRSSGVGFWYCDLPFDVLQWDDLVKAHFHLPPDARVMIDTFYERIHPEDREPTRLAIEKSIADHESYDVDYRTVDPRTGDVKWIRAIGRTFYAADGSPNRFDGVTLDITARKRAEQEVARLAAESERQRRLYETVLTNTPDLVYVFNLDYKFVYANEALLRMWGRGYEDSVGKGLLEIGYEPWHAEMHEREIDQVRATKKPIRGVVPFNGTDGIRQYDYIFVPVIGADGEVEAVAGTTRDVTERNEDQNRQAFLIRLGDTLRPLSDPAEVQSEASRELGEWLGANRVAYFEISGGEYVVERDYARDVPSLAGRYPVESFGTALITSYMASRTVVETDATIEPDRPDGERAAFAAIRVRGHVDVPLVKNGRFLAGMTVHFSEPREWTRQEVALIEDTAERTWATVERARAEEERERLLKKLQEQDKRKDEFLATLAHELRNPLAPIHNGLQIMRMAGVSDMLEDARAMMERQLTQLIRLVDDLLDVSRVTSGKLALRSERVELKSIIDAAVETSGHVIEQAGQKWDIVVPDAPIYVHGDATRLAQVVSNLLNNAAKYTPRGGHIQLTVRREGDQAVIVVADDGIGIPPHMVSKVFEMFTQVDRALEKTTGGLGIGLSLAKGLVEMQGGTIEGHSEGEGRGSEFIVRLPALPAESLKVNVSPLRQSADPTRRRRILVADDNVDSAQSMERLLKMLGNDVVTANDGLQALETAEAFRPNVILLDIGMPRLNGYDVCARIREESWGKDVFLVAMTGWGQEEDKRRSHEAGFDLHLVKPVDFEAIKKLLAS